jgi:hypothetical protein
MCVDWRYRFFDGSKNTHNISPYFWKENIRPNGLIGIVKVLSLTILAFDYKNYENGKWWMRREESL